MTETTQIDFKNVYRIPKIRIRFNGRTWIAVIPAFFKDLEKTYYEIYLKIDDNNIIYLGRKKIYNTTYKNLAFSLPKNQDKLWMEIVEKYQYVEAILIKNS
jgi:hypothetical protein